jgi:hypothetical protein
MVKKNLVPFTDAEEKFINKMIEKRNSVVQKRDNVEVRFPLLTALAVTFGFVSTLYGFEKMIDRVDLFVNKPWILLVTGVLILSVTGALYKKLN